MLRSRILFPVFWIAWTAFHIWFLVFQGWDRYTALTDSLCSNILLMAICLGVFYSARYNRPGEKRIVYYLGGLLIAAGLYSWLSRELLIEFHKENSAYLAYLESSFAIRFITGFILIALFAMTGWLQQFVKEQKDEMNRKAENEKLSKESELLHLRRQLQPHFLFNTLNSVNALIGTNPSAAKYMIQQLSDFLRSTIKRDDFSLVAFSEEIHLLKLYLDIEKVRFGNRLQVEFEFGPDTGNMNIPVFLLQPLVENAVKYGLYDTLEAVTITIKCNFQNPFLKVSISNPFDTVTSVSVPGAGFGLESVKRRLFLLYNRNDLVEISSGENIFTVTLKIPQTV